MDISTLERGAELQATRQTGGWMPATFIERGNDPDLAWVDLRFPSGSMGTGIRYADELRLPEIDDV